MRLVSTLCVVAASSAMGEIIGGSITVIDPPAAVGNNNQQSALLLGFNEMQNVRLDADLMVAGVTITEGSFVSSHYIIVDPVNSTRITGNAIFDGDVLAIVETNADLDATNGLFGATGTTYATLGLSGLESGDSVTIGPANEIFVDATASSPGDYVRILTVGIPAPGVLSAFGVVAGLATRRR